MKPVWENFTESNLNKSWTVYKNDGVWIQTKIIKISTDYYKETRKVIMAILSFIYLTFI